MQSALGDVAPDVSPASFRDAQEVTTSAGREAEERQKEEGERLKRLIQFAVVQQVADAVAYVLDDGCGSEGKACVCHPLRRQQRELGQRGESRDDGDGFDDQGEPQEDFCFHSIMGALSLLIAAFVIRGVDGGNLARVEL